MIAEISSLISFVKTACDIAKGLSTFKSDVDRNESISKILEILLSIQTQVLSVNAIAQKLQEEKYEITQKLMKFEKWSETETQYELKEIASGVFVYACKKINPPSEPMHWLCTNCWKDRMKSIIQKTLSDSYTCPKCKTELYPFLDRGGDVSSIQNSDPFQHI